MESDRDTGPSMTLAGMLTVMSILGLIWGTDVFLTLLVCYLMAMAIQGAI